MSCRTREAYEYYAQHMLSPLRAKAPVYKERNLPMEGLAPFRDWEVLVAILVDDKGSALRSGADLLNHEVKSAKKGGGFEYQYHRVRGLEKLDHDLTIEHLRSCTKAATRTWTCIHSAPSSSRKWEGSGGKDWKKRTPTRAINGIAEAYPSRKSRKRAAPC